MEASLLAIWLCLAGAHAPAESASRPVSLRDAALLMSGQLGGDLDVGLATLQVHGSIVALLSVPRPHVAARLDGSGAAPDPCVATITAYVLDPNDTIVANQRIEDAPCDSDTGSPRDRRVSVPLSWDLTDDSYRIRVLVRLQGRFALAEQAIEVDTSSTGGWVAIDARRSHESRPATRATTTTLTLPDKATARPVIEAGTRLVLATLEPEGAETIWAADTSGTFLQLPRSDSARSGFARTGSAHSGLGERAPSTTGNLRSFEADTSPLEPGTYTLHLDTRASPILRLDVIESTKPRETTGTRPIESLPARGDDEAPSPAIVSGYRSVLSDLIAGRREQATDALQRLETTLVDARGDAAYGELDTAVDQLEQLFASCPGCRLPLAILFADLAHGYDEARWAVLAAMARGRALAWAETLASHGDDDLRRHASAIITRLAEDLQRSGLYGRAANHFETARDLTPTLVTPRALLAILHEKHGRYRDVVTTLAPVAAAPDLDDLSRLRLAINQARTGRTSQAREQLTRLTRSTTPWIALLAWQERIRLAVEAEAWQVARAHLRSALTRWPDQATLSVLDAWVHAHTKTHGAAAHESLGAPTRDHPGVDDARYRYHRWPVGLLDEDRRLLDRAAETWLPRLAEALQGFQDKEPAR